jgi:peptidoglycan hydrolase-like protein with peptidoglycan-binding domain/3D (Asp-Asp-Asp) domain-containing protein
MKIKISDILVRLSCCSLTIFVSILHLSPFASFHGDLAAAEEFDFANSEDVDAELSFPYSKTFTISAYYSPLPCQNKYTTGSYEGDIRLNGSGVRGADGTPVYPGMIAAPKSYPFGTKMYIPSIGIVAVHDRGGAIVASSGADGLYDRLDIWMGYGDEGLKRALNWGKRNVEVTVYGINENVIEDIYLDGYSADEAMVSDCSSFVALEDEVFEIDSSEVEISLPVTTVTYDEASLLNDLSLGDEGSEVFSLQEELNKLNFYKAEINGIFDENTKHSVFKFQQSQLLVGDLTSPGAGFFGPKTRDRLNEIISSRTYTNGLIALATAEKAASDSSLALESGEVVIDETEVALVTEKTPILTSELGFGAVGDDVVVLQEFLMNQGFFNAPLTTDYFGTVTLNALIDFQLHHGIITSPQDVGAGRVGPATLSLINSLS